MDIITYKKGYYIEFDDDDMDFLDEIKEEWNRYVLKGGNQDGNKTRKN